jgi:hypothetical protein
MANLLIFQRLIPVLSLRTLATSSRGLKKDYPWSDYLEKLPDPLINYTLIILHVRFKQGIDFGKKLIIGIVF